MIFKDHSSLTKKIEIQTGVVVVGFGGAGACAAIEAHDAGADVIVLEKQPEINHYSNTRMSGGGFHSPDPTGDKISLKEYSKAMLNGENIPWKFESKYPDLSDELAEAWVKYAPYNKKFLYSLDPDFKTVDFDTISFPQFPGARKSGYRVCRSTYTGKVKYEVGNKDIGEIKYTYRSTKDLPKLQKEGGEAVHACLLNGIKNRDIDIHYETSANKLEMNEKGEVIGVRAERKGIQVIYKTKRAVVLTSGGFEFNKLLRSAFLEGPGNEGWAFYGTSSNSGDGIIMALEAGAALSKVANVSARLTAAAPIKKNGLKIGMPLNVFGRANEIVVDNYGNRYTSERRITKDPSRYCFYKEAVVFDIEKLLYPRIPSWMIFDETLRKKRTIVNTVVTEYHSIPWSEDNLEAVDKGWILKASTIEELALMIRNHPDNRYLMEPQALIESVKRYNEFCRNSNDKDFHREVNTLGPIDNPPFYALPLYVGGPNTKGGILANAKGQVLNWGNQPIPRLYSAGEISSAFKFVYSAGGNIAECITFGRIAGLNAASEKPL